MRNLSRLGLKLLGILLIYWAASEFARDLAGIPPLFVQWSPPEKAALMRALRRDGFASEIVECIVPGTFAAILLSRTEWIISKFRLPEEPDSMPIMAPGELLRVCLIVVGTVAVVRGIPGIAEGLAWAVLIPRGINLGDASPDKYDLIAMAKAVEINTLGESVASIMQFVLGCALVVKSRTLASKALAL